MTFDVTDPARPGSTDTTGTAVAQATAPHQREPLEPTSRRLLPHTWHEQLRELLPLLLVLTVQAALSLRLANTAFADEALVLTSGHQEIAGLVHGAAGTPDFASYFSGEPFLYPLLAAAVGGHFGLGAVRLLSLLFMLGATTLLWSSTRALFGRSAAIGATIVFGFAGPTLFLGHFAIYDVPAVLLYAASFRILIATARRSLWTVLLAVPTTVLAIATSYATALYLPVLALVAVFAAATDAPGRDRRLRHLARGALFVGAVVVLIGGWLALLGPSYRQGLETTTTNRLVGSDNLDTILGNSIAWGIAALALGLIGTIAVARRHRADPCDPHHVAPVLLTLTLALSVLLAPAYQWHIHTLQSLQKHIDIGLLFAAVAAGVAISIPLRAALRARTCYGVVAVTALVLAAVGAVQSGDLFSYWPNSTPLVSALKQAMGKGGGHYLAEASTVPEYYTAGLPDGARNDWENTYFFGYVDAAGKYVTGPAAYRQAVAEHYFKLIVLSYNVTPALDHEIDTPLKEHDGYRLIDVIPTSDVFGKSEFDVWERD